MSIVTIQDVKISTVQNGKGGYSVADVVFTDGRGENKQKKVMSFSNPAVFAFLSKIKSPTKAQVENGGAPYYNWTKIEPASSEVTGSAPAASPRSTTYNDNRETSEERARRQVMIVKQSSLANAISYFEAINAAPDGPEHVIEVAQQFVDWVMKDGSEVFNESAEEA